MGILRPVPTWVHDPSALFFFSPDYRSPYDDEFTIVNGVEDATTQTSDLRGGPEVAHHSTGISA